MQRIKQSLTRFFRTLFFMVRIEGESMWPILVPGMRYCASALLKPIQGDCIVFRDPRFPDRILVKRVSAYKNENYFVESLVSWGDSSKDFGGIPRDSILGTVIRNRLKNGRKN